MRMNCNSSSEAETASRLPVPRRQPVSQGRVLRTLRITLRPKLEKAALPWTGRLPSQPPRELELPMPAGGRAGSNWPSGRTALGPRDAL